MRLRALPALLFAVGIAGTLAIVVHAGAGAVLRSMGAIGWGVVPVLAVRLGLVALMGAAWWLLAPRGSGAPFLPFAFARLIRDSASECLPLSQLGGFVLGARALTLGGIGGAFAAASTAVDVTLELVAQLLYLAGGLASLWALRPHLPLVHSVAVGTALLGVGAAVFLLLQSRGTAWAERSAARRLRRWPSLADGATSVLRALADVHASPVRVGGAIGLHLAAWIGNGLEGWLILDLMGHPIGLRGALTIDSLLYGLRSFAFMVPNALGVQEAGYVLLGGLFGLDMQTCLALSLLRRARDLVLGVPALLAWQAMEGRRLQLRPAAAADARAREGART